MKIRVRSIVLALVALALVGVLLLVTGAVPIKASSGHWPITFWFLSFASDRSIAFHSLGTDVPNLDQSGLLRLGAETYEANCEWCHGHPGDWYRPIMQSATPSPPVLAESALKFDAAELHYTVLHGIKFTGMPAWPAVAREDEVWPVVAFLQQVPRMTKAEYEKLVTIPSSVQPGSATMELARRRCAMCHGLRGEAPIHERVPVLAGQSNAYLSQTLLAYANQDRTSGVMQPIANRLEPDTIRELADFYSAQDAVVRRLDRADINQPELLELGKRLVLEGDRDDKIAACVDCHAVSMAGPSESRQQNDDYPLLAGQPAWYLRRQLVLFKDRIRGGTQNSNLMHPIADMLSEKQREAVSAYFESLNDSP